MKWFDKFITRCVQRHRNLLDGGECVKSYHQPDRLSSGQDRLRSQSMTFNIHSASGGHVLEYSVYNNKTDQHENTLHLIPSSEELGQSIGHAITLEMLRK
jgi:hypothetical protein